MSANAVSRKGPSFFELQSQKVERVFVWCACLGVCARERQKRAAAKRQDGEKAPPPTTPSVPPPLPLLSRTHHNHNPNQSNP
jgi:hypothetical protein